MTTAPADYFPPSMPGVDTDHTGGRRMAAGLLDDVARESVPLAEGFRAPELSDGVRRAAADALDAISEVRGRVHTTAAHLDALAVNDLLPDRGRDRLTRETRTVAGQALDAIADRSETALKLLEAGLMAAAQPAFPDGQDREEARQELRMLLDASEDPAQTIRRLAAGADQRLAALAAGSYGSTYLRSRGIPEPVITATATFAAQAATASSDPRRAAAARALVQVAHVRKLRSKALNAASFAIGWGA
jgi:hypothetical protein